MPPPAGTTGSLSADRLADTIAELLDRIEKLERAPRLDHASIHNTPLRVYSPDDPETVRQTIGMQPDGTITTVDTNGPTPPVPTPPVLEERAGTLVVTWDGLFAEGAARPADWDHVEVHVSTVSGYDPSDLTEVFTFHAPKGGSVTLALDPVEQFVRLQAVSTSLVESAPTDQVAGTPLPTTTANGVSTYYETEAPVGLDTDDTGSLWFDTNDGNHPYRWDGDSWVSIRDAAIAAAASAASTAQTNALSALTAAQAAQATADGAIRTYYQSTAPSGLNGTSDVGDLWFDTDDGQAYRWNGSSWLIIEDNSIAAALAAAQNAQTTADGKITAYYQNSAPTIGEVGDLWYDTDDANKPYYCSTGSTPGPIAWTPIRDGAIAVAQAAADAANAAAATALASAQTAQTTADGKAVAYFQTSAPTGMVAGDVGDLWFDTDDGNKLYRWNGSAWVVAQDQAIATAINAAAAANTAAGNAQTTADSKITTLYQTAAPSGSGRTTGDLWVDTDDGNNLYRWNGSAWISIRDATIATAQAAADAANAAAATALTSAQNAQTTADGKAVAYFQTSAPTGLVAADAGDLWFDTDDGNKLYRWNGSAWVVAQDQAIATAITAANAANTAAGTAQTTADSKITTLYQTAAPSGTGRTTGDLWVDTDDANKLYRWSGAAWVSIRDLTIATAQTTADNALDAATTDGVGPPSSPTPILTGGYAAIHIRVNPVANADPVQFRYYVSKTAGFTPDGTTLVHTGPETAFTYRPASPDFNALYYVRVVEFDADNSAAAGPQASVQMFQVGQDAISAAYAYFGNVSINQLTGGVLAGELVLANIIKTAQSGARVEIGPFGIIIYGSGGGLETVLPADGSGSRFKGSVEASGFTVTGAAAFRGTAEISRGAVMTLATSSTAPSAAPTAVPTWNTVVYTLFKGNYGLAWNGTELVTAGDSAPPQARKAAGAVTFPLNDPRPWGGVTYLGGYYYTLGWKFEDIGAGAYVYVWYVTKYDNTGAKIAQGVYNPVEPPFGSGGSLENGIAPAAIGNDGTNIIVGEFDSANNRFRITTHSAATCVFSSNVNTSVNSGFTGPVVGIAKGTFDFGSTRTIILSRNGQHHWPFDTSATPTYQPNDAWASPAPGTMSGFAWDGTRFWSTNAKSAQQGTVFGHCTYKWTGVDPQPWNVDTAWRNAAGGYETPMSPWVTIQMKKRAYLTITPDTIPAQGGTSPDAFSAFISNSGTARTQFFRQTLPAAGVNTLTVGDDIVFSGNNPPAPPGTFPPASTSGVIQSGASDTVGALIDLRGDGYARLRDAIVGQHNIRKTANESVSVSATQQNDDHLLFIALANSTYEVELELLAQANNSTSGIKFGWSLPTGSLFDETVVGPGLGVTATPGDMGSSALIGGFTATHIIGIPGSSTTVILRLKTRIVIGATGGTCNLQWSQNTAGNTTTLLLGSWMKVIKTG